MEEEMPGHDEFEREGSLSRRRFVAALAAVSTGLAGGRVPAARRESPEGVEASPAGGRIDVHHHIVPPFYVEAMNRAGYGNIGGVPFPRWGKADLDRSFDVLGIRKAILSVSSPGVAVEDTGLERELARRVNEYCADLVRAYGPRAGAFASIPVSSAKAAIEETGFALDRLGLNGVCLFSSISGTYLGDPRLDEYMEYLDSRNGIVFLHPTLPLERMWPDVSIDPPLVEFVFETTRAVANMLYNGIFERFPNIRFIVAHLGGTIPFVSWRLGLFEHSAREAFRDFRRRCPRPVSEYLASLYYEVAVSCSPGNLRNVLSFVPAEHVLFGTDYPFAAQSFIDLNSATLDEPGLLDATVLQKISHENAERLFGFEP